MEPNEKQKIEIEKLHRDPLPPLNQAVTADYSDFLGTALTQYTCFMKLPDQCRLLRSTSNPKTARLYQAADAR
jgi:hypothetical protein